MFKKKKFIVIDGADGSGKTTQFNMLVDSLKKRGEKIKTFDFPQYGKKSAGLVEEYLNGKYGEADKVGPRRASIFYACDRYDASFKLKKYLNLGYTVISNRYVSANMGHQGEKIKNPKKRKEFFGWLYELEYKIFKIPKPDLNIILSVDTKITKKLIEQKKLHNRKRSYIKNGLDKDIHEKNIEHLARATKVYLEIADQFDDFTLINCVKNDKIIKREEIHKLILEKVI